MARVHVVACFYGLLLCARLASFALFLVISIVCLGRKVIIERCGNLPFSHYSKRSVDLIAIIVECGSSVTYVVTICLWSRFSAWNFLRALPRMAVFWFWFALFTTYVLSVLSFDILDGRTSLGISLLSEVLVLTILCCALKFVKKITVKRSLERWLEVHQKYATFLYYLYMATMWSYLFRNMSQFVYDTTVLVGKIKRPGRFDHIDRLLLLLNCAMRGSFSQFFYSIIFRNPKVPVVCDNVDNCRSHDLYGPIGVANGTGIRQPLVVWESPIEEAMRKSQIWTGSPRA